MYVCDHDDDDDDDDGGGGGGGDDDDDDGDGGVWRIGKWHMCDACKVTSSPHLSNGCQLLPLSVDIYVAEQDVGVWFLGHPDGPGVPAHVPGHFAVVPSPERDIDSTSGPVPGSRIYDNQ